MTVPVRRLAPDDPGGFTAALIDELLDVALGRESVQRFVQHLLGQLRQSAVAGATHIAELLNVAETVGQGTRGLEQFIVDHLPTLEGVSLTTRTQIRDALQAAIRNGEGLDGQVQAIRNVFTAADAGRARTIARTENSIFWHAGQRQQMEATGVPARVWITSRDLRVRPSHAVMDNQCQPLQQPFTSGLGNALMYPGDPDGPPEDVINCRCTEAPLTSGCASRSAWLASPQARTLYWKRSLARQLVEERKVLRVVRQAFRTQRDRVLARVGRMFPGARV